MIKRTIAYVEKGSWEEDIERFHKGLEWVCWVVIIAAALYFAPVCWKALTDVKGGAIVDCPKCGTRLIDDEIHGKFIDNHTIDVSVKCLKCGHALFVFVPVSDLTEDKEF